MLLFVRKYLLFSSFFSVKVFGENCLQFNKHIVAMQLLIAR